MDSSTSNKDEGCHAEGKKEEASKAENSRAEGDSKENTNGEIKDDQLASNKKSPTSAAEKKTIGGLTPPINGAINGSTLPSQQQQTQIHQHHMYTTYHPILPAYSFPRQPPLGLELTGQSPLNPHQYTDLSYCQDPAKDTKRNRGGVTQAFPEKLHEMLDGVERDGQSDIVSFFSHGRAFAIHKPRKFVQEVLHKYFRQGKLTSFQRQLNLYGFKRISQGPDNGGYWHELFLKGRPGLCVNMKRTKVRGTTKKKRDPASEPNFYAYPPIGAAPSAVAMAMTQPALTTAGTMPGGSSPTAAMTPYHQGMAYFPFNHHHQPQLPMLTTRPPGPYTAAQRPSVPVFPVPPGTYPSYQSAPVAARGTTPPTNKPALCNSKDDDNPTGATASTGTSTNSGPVEEGGKEEEQKSL